MGSIADGESHTQLRAGPVTRRSCAARCPWRRWLVFGLVLLCAVGQLSSTEATVRVVTTVAPVTDLVRQVGGEAIQLHSLVPTGISSHTFHPTPGDVQYLVGADLVVLNGLNLEAGVEKLLRCCGNPRATLVKLAEEAVAHDEWIGASAAPAQGLPNPHLWVNVEYARRYVERIRDHLCRLDSQHVEHYRHNASRLIDELSHLDQCIAVAVASISPPHRQLVTYHDAWPYFARRYGFTVIRVVQPANFAEPSPREVARVIDQLRQTPVPAIFSSEIFPSTVPQKIAREAGIPRVDMLHDEILPGVPGEAVHSYQGMMQRNVTTIVAALGGNPVGFAQCLAQWAGR